MLNKSKVKDKDKTKIAISDGFYACPFCDNRKVKESDKYCYICSRTFSFENEMSTTLHENDKKR